MKEHMTEMTIKGIAMDQKSDLPILILQSRENGAALPIWIGPFEASAIITEMEGVHPPRPLTHDLFSLFLSKHNFTINRLEIYGRVEDRYFARLEYRHGIRNYRMEVRPSDGVALALRLGAPIMANDELVDSRVADNFLLNNSDNLSSEILFLKKDQLKTYLM